MLSTLRYGSDGRPAHQLVLPLLFPWSALTSPPLPPAASAVPFPLRSLGMSFWTRWLKTAPSRPARRSRVARTARRPLGLVQLLEGRTVPSAVVLTDKPDYAAGSTALFTAT